MCSFISLFFFLTYFCLSRLHLSTRHLHLSDIENSNKQTNKKTVQILQSRSVLRPNKLIGSFKLDVATVWLQKGKTLYILIDYYLPAYAIYQISIHLIHLSNQSLIKIYRYTPIGTCSLHVCIIELIQKLLYHSFHSFYII